MRLRWTLVRATTGYGGDGAPATDVSTDVTADCGAGTTLGELRSADGADDLLGDATVLVDGEVLSASAVVGRAPLLDGAVLRLVQERGESEGARPGRHRAPGVRGAVPGTPVAPAARPHLLELAVLAGPDAGRTFPLPRSRLTCGRAGSGDIVIADPRLSRAHCDLVVGTEGVSLVDLGSTNGSVVGDAGAAVRAPTGLRLGERCLLGASLVTLRSPAVRDAAATGRPSTAGDEGTVQLLRSPRTRPAEQATELRLPAPARRARGSTFPVLSVVLPALAGGALAMWTGSAVYLLLAGLGPLLVAGGWVSARRDSRREGTLTAREHARECARIHAEARAAADGLARARSHALPDADALLRAARSRGRRLWERGLGDEDALRVRLGTAAAPTTGGDRTSPHPGARAAGATVLRPTVRLVDHEGAVTPVATAEDLVSVDLRDGALGVVERPVGTSAARFAVGQLVALLPPDDLLVVPVLGPGAVPRWRWLWLLPHTLTTEVPDTWPTTVAQAVRAVADLVESRGCAGGAGPAVLVVVDDPDGTLGDGDLVWLAEAHRVGVHVVVVAADRDRLPRGLRHVVVPTSDDEVEAAVLRPDGTGERFVVDRVAGSWAERLSRGLAPLRLAPEQARAGLPDQVRLDQLLDLGVAAVAHRWDTAPDSLRVPLGIGEEGPFEVDLAEVGPHALLAGTTGSGKSELLRSWLLALAATCPPEDLALLLVDYKGGATFDDLAGLPHVVGLLTDLDGAATSRVLQSMKAEVRRREQLLADAGARDLASYRALPGVPARDPLARLLVVVDEFRVLAEEAPQVLGEFVRLAATGRSLGIHLVLATQRPGGVVSADIRANTGLRIALRVQDPAESRDVVDGPDAAALPAGRPGRAVVVGGGRHALVQGAWVAPPDGRGGRRARVRAVHPPGARRLDDTLSPEPWVEPGAAHPTGSAAPAAVADIARAAERTGRERATSPWLPPLPERIVVPAQHAWAGTGGGHSPATRLTENGLVLATADLPWAQARATLTWDPPADGALLVLGGPRSGRSTTVATVAAAAAALDIPVVRLSGEAEDADHTVDVLTALASPAADDGRHGTGPPRLGRVLLVDDTDELLDPAADPAAVDLLLRLVRSGHRDGTGVVLAGGRTLATSRLAGGAGARLVHRTADRADATVAGLPSSARTTSTAPGRCLVLGLPSRTTGAATWARGTVVEAQVHLPSGDHGQAVSVPPGVPSPLPVRAHRPPVAHRTSTAESGPGHLARGHGGPDGRRAIMGLLPPDGRLWGPDLGTRDLWVVAGPPRSGRSTALDLLVDQVDEAGVPVLRLGAGHDHPRGSAPQLLVVDDVDRLPVSSLDDLERWLAERAGPLADVLDPEAATVLAGSAEWFAAEFRGVPALVRRHGRGVVLHAGRTDTRDVLGVRSPLVQRTRVPGRGLLVDRGRVTRIQLLLPGSSPSPAADLAVRDADTAAGH